MNTATLSRLIRDHRTGQVHLPHEMVMVLGLSENLGRTLIKVNGRRVENRFCSLTTSRQLQISSRAGSLYGKIAPSNI